jgi:hypothetical protein
MSPSHLIATRERLFALRSRRMEPFSGQNFPSFQNRQLTTTKTSSSLSLSSSSSSPTSTLSTSLSSPIQSLQSCRSFSRSPSSSSSSVPIDLTDENEIECEIDSSHHSESDNLISFLPPNSSITLIDDDDDSNCHLANNINNTNTTMHNNNNKMSESDAEEESELSDDIKKQVYIPKYRSGPWAILLAMYIASLRQQRTDIQKWDFDCTTKSDTTSLPLQTLKKSEIIKLATPLCDSSFESHWDEVQISQSTPSQQTSFK